ncbi:MAG: hypothetical protein PSX71_03910 [bacterium]|nr:hypothetical protein [bacterium]
MKKPVMPGFFTFKSAGFLDCWLAGWMEAWGGCREADLVGLARFFAILPGHLQYQWQCSWK